MTKEIRNPNDEPGRLPAGASGFGLRRSFFIRHPTFDIFPAGLAPPFNFKPKTKL
jgi:hypothetical protein